MVGWECPTNPREASGRDPEAVHPWLFAITLSAWVVRITAFGPQAWPASATIGQIPGLAVTVAVAVFSFVAVVVAARPRTWYGADKLQEEAIGKRR
ncbi:DUF2270 domain-containing protein [Haladaptatus sp. NG-SE-30]